jgi:hypothetical protein
MASTLLLDRSAWDLCVTAGGDIAVATEPYSQVQDVASACRVFAGECWYDTTLGIPYFQQVFRGAQPVQILRARLRLAALTVPGVTAASVVLSAVGQRTVRGQVQVTTTSGVVTAVL